MPRKLIRAPGPLTPPTPDDPQVDRPVLERRRLTRDQRDEFDRKIGTRVADAGKTPFRPRDTGDEEPPHPKNRWIFPSVAYSRGGGYQRDFMKSIKGNDASNHRRRLRGQQRRLAPARRSAVQEAMNLTPSDRQLCSQSTVSRLENLPNVHALLRMGRAMVDLFCASFREVPKRITLDVDDTFDAVHGGQQLRLFNAHYDDYGFQPMVVFDGAGRFVAAVLRPARRASGREARAFLRRLVRAIRANWPRAEIRVLVAARVIGISDALPGGFDGDGSAVALAARVLKNGNIIRRCVGREREAWRYAKANTDGDRVLSRVNRVRRKRPSTNSARQRDFNR